MATIITEECINCGACEPECPNGAISQGDDIYIIDPKLCTECVGFHDEEACAAVCPVDCCVQDPDNLETEEQLYARARRRSTPARASRRWPSCRPTCPASARPESPSARARPAPRPRRAGARGFVVPADRATKGRPMDMLTGGQLVARMLKKEGVGTVFTLSGLHIAPIYVGLVEEGIRIVDTRHEQAAAHAADAWARLTRGMGVAIVTAGPGVTDAVTGVANAWAANSPLLVIGGAAPTFNQGRGSLQEMPQTQLFQGITKWSDRVPSPELLPSYLAKAFRVARAGRPGPVFLEIPWDVLSNGADGSVADSLTHYRTDARSPGDPHKVEQALSLLADAERPVILGGSSIWWTARPPRSTSWPCEAASRCT